MSSCLALGTFTETPGTFPISARAPTDGWSAEQNCELSPTFPSSDKVLELVKARLAACSYHAVRSVLCEFRQGLLILRGRLPSFFHKQIAQEAVAGLAGVAQVVNQIEVVVLART